MGEKIPCACCGHPVSVEAGLKCGYCGYIQVAIVGGTTKYDRRAREHRTEVIAKLTDISVSAYRYGWMEEKQKYGLLEKRRLKLADGPACGGGVFWTDLRFGQALDEGGKHLTMEIFYCYDGSEQRVERTLQPPASDACWGIGLEINERLELVIHLGSRQADVESQPIPFIQKRRGSE